MGIGQASGTGGRQERLKIQRFFVGAGLFLSGQRILSIAGYHLE
jgi:hypothetical protein